MARTAEVKRDARIGEADAKRDAQIKEAIAEEERMAARLLNDAEIAKSKRDFELKKAAYDVEVHTKVKNIVIVFFIIHYIILYTLYYLIFVFHIVLPFHIQKAEAELAYELQAAKTKQRIKDEQMQIKVVERTQEILVQVTISH